MNKAYLPYILFGFGVAIILFTAAFLKEYEHRMSVIFVGVVLGIVGMILKMGKSIGK